MKRILRRGMLRLVFQVLRRVSPRQEIAGVEVLLIGSPPDASGSLAVVAQAIACVQRLDARRWSLMARHFKRIGIAEYGNSQFIPGLSACILATATLEKGAVHTAGVMVHELAHARLFACGFSYHLRTRRDPVPEARAGGGAAAEAYATQAARAFKAQEPWYSEPRLQQYRKDAMTFYGVPAGCRSCGPGCSNSGVRCPLTCGCLGETR